MVKLTKDRIKLAESLYKHAVCRDDPYFSIEYIIEKILNVENKYCPECFKKINSVNSDTFAPVCDCGWIGNFIDLLTENQKKKEIRKLKLNNIKKQIKYGNKRHIRVHI